MRANTQVNARQTKLKNYFPFESGMRGDDISVGANYQNNLSPNQGILEKKKQAEIFVDIKDFDSIEYIASHTPTTGDDQTLVFGYISGVLKLRVIDSDGTIITPATETVSSATGTVTGTLGSTTLTGSGSSYLSELTIGDYVQIDPGDGRVYKITDIASDTEATIDREYLGTTISGSTLKIYTNYGGTGDASFFGTITTRQKGDYTIIGSGGSAKMWNGYGITALSGVGTISMAHDGSRIGYIDVDGKAKFTDNSPTDGFTGGTGANAAGEYNTGIPVCTAIVEGGTGVVLFGERLAEAHWVEPNSASDEVSSRTKIESFSYRGSGVKNERFVASTGSTIVFMNEDGVFELDPYSGQFVNLIIGGKIERYWKEKIDPSNGFVVYDQENDTILACVALNSPQNNVFIAFDRREKGKPPFFVDNQYLACAGVVNGKIIGGANSGGVTTKLFDKFLVADATTSKSQYITEFDGLGSVQTVKNFQGVNIVAEASPESTVKVKVYFNNETEPSFEKTHLTKDLTTRDEGAVYGSYVFSVGVSDLTQEPVIRAERQKNGMRFNTIAIEVWEESVADFKLYDIILEYKQSNRLSQSVSLKHNLF
jgi:hypothetical protein